MKHILLLFCFYLIISISGFSQKIYVRAGIGKNWSNGSNYITSNTWINKVGLETQITEEIVKGTFNSGTTGNFILGFSFKEFYAIEAGFSYVNGNTYKGTQFNVNANRITETRTYNSSVPAGTLSLVIEPTKNKISPYAKAGLVFAKPKIAYSNIDESNPINSYELGTEAYGNLAIGLQGGLGMSYSITNKLGIFLESTFTSMSYAPAEQEVLKYEVGGVDKYSSIPNYIKKNVYSEKVTKYYQEDGDERQDNNSSFRTQLQYHYAMGSIGLQIGIRYNLSK